MENMIRKELLVEVLNKEITDFSVHTGFIWFKHKDYSSNINTYELAHRCKKWALDNGYIINSGATTSNDWCSTIYKVIKDNPYIKELSHTWEQTEPQSIFKACQWILDNKGIK